METITQEHLDRYTIRSHQFVSCNQAFVDCRTPGSDQKENYSFIGPGVTQSSEQFVNLKDAHGFNIGAAAMPKGCVNNLHTHFTAEVFFIYKGDWEFKWGNQGENTAVLGEGTVFSPMTWLFRGFRNVGVDDGFVFTVLGGDDTGGIIWHPEVLKTAASHGLFLSVDNQLLDTVENPDVTKDVQLIEPLTEEQMQVMHQVSPEQMTKRFVLFKDLVWSEKALLCSSISGHHCSVAPVIGWGMTQEKEHISPIYTPHGFSIEWLKIPVGQSVALHSIAEHEVLKMYQGKLKVTLNRQEEEKVSSLIEAKDILSVPQNSWRTFENVGDDDVYVLVVLGGDAPNAITWDSQVIEQAHQSGYAIDHKGYITLYSLIKHSK